MTVTDEYLTVDTYLSQESRGDKDFFNRLGDALLFLSESPPLMVGTVLELEMIVMHVAHMVNPANKFRDNNNVGVKYGTFVDHVSVMLDSDVTTWCRLLYEQFFWPASNRQVTNLIYNWLNGTLGSPRVLIGV